MSIIILEVFFMKEKKSFWLWLFIPIVIGGISGLISKKGMDLYKLQAVKPPLNPPQILFPIVWTVLYLIMGYCIYKVVSTESEHKNEALIAFWVQIVLNFLWSPVFFNFRAYKIASIILVALIVAVIIQIVTFCKVDKKAGLWQIPYLIWLMFALYLNIATDMLNQM